MVGWLDQIAEVVRVGGKLLLVVPDKRYTFDYLRKTSTLSSLVDAFVLDCKTPTPGQVFDFNAHAANVDKDRAWAGQLDPATLDRYSNPRKALELSRASHREGRYVDSHCWVFTPAVLLDLCADLVELELLRWKLVFFADTKFGDEDFGLVLERAATDDDRVEVAARFRGASVQAAPSEGASETVRAGGDGDTDRRTPTARQRWLTAFIRRTAWRRD